MIISIMVTLMFFFLPLPCRCQISDVLLISDRIILQTVSVVLVTPLINTLPVWKV